MERTSNRAERRNLTVLFADIVGSSALATRLDPEDLQVILRSVQASFRDAAKRYGGHIARYLGDGVLAFFGFPVAHEDDAERAVNAALQMIASVSASSFSDLSGPPQLHIGIATGLVVVGDVIGEGTSREFELIGEAPNLAAWLQQHAAPNQILVSSQTRRLLGNLFEVADLGQREVKGYQQPLRVWSILRQGTLQSRFDAQRSAQLSPFVGRDTELRILITQYEKTKNGRGQVVAISGEPGIGKSRLIAMLYEGLAGETFRTLWFQCSSYHTLSPWHPIIRHLEYAAGISSDDSPSVKLENLENFVSSHVSEQRDGVVPLLAALLSIPIGDHYPVSDLTPQQQKRRTLAALANLLRGQPSQRPVIVVFEDVHWIDPSSAELLQLLQEQAKEMGILMIVSFRPEFRPPWQNDPETTSIVISPLEPTYAARLVASLAGRHSLPVPVVAQIVGKSDGVPLFIEEVTKTILQTVSVSEAEAVSGPRSVFSVPDTLHDSLMARLDQMRHLKAIAQISATIGREFTLDVLEAVAPFPTNEVHAAIDALVSSGLVLQQENRTENVYTFRHALLQETAYSSILRSERLKLHARIAEILCTSFPGIAESAPELVAHHYTQAREAKQAAIYWLKAGRQASKSSALVEASEHFQNGLKLLPQLPETVQRDELELEIQQALASAFVAVKGFGAAETMQAFDRCLQLCQRVEQTSHIFGVINGLAGVYYMRGDFGRCRSLAEDLFARASQENDVSALLMSHRILGMSLFARGELHDAHEHLRRAVEMYDPPSHAPLSRVFSQDLKATAQVYLGLTSVLLGDIEAGLADSREAFAYAEELRHPHSISYVLAFLAGSHLLSGMPEAGHSMAERTIALSDEYGFPQWVAGGLLLRGWAAIELGQGDKSILDIRDAISGLEATGTLVWIQFARFLLARALTMEKRFEEAAEVVDDLLEDLTATGGSWYEAEVQRLRGDLLFATGRPVKEVEAHYEAALSVAVRQGARLWEARALNALAQMRLSQGLTSGTEHLAAPRGQLDESAADRKRLTTEFIQPDGSSL